MIGWSLRGIGANQQCGIDVLQRGQRLSQRGTQRGLVLVAEIHLPQAMVDVVHTQAAGKRLQQ